jgi:hypothetical protein
LWGRAVGRIVPRAPGLIWVHGLVAGDVMVDGSIRGGRLRPLGLWWTAAWAGVAEAAGAGRKTAFHLGVVGLAEQIGGGQGTGSRASGPSSRSVWKQRRASLRAIVSDALVCESPRALSAR